MTRFRGSMGSVPLRLSFRSVSTNTGRAASTSSRRRISISQLCRPTRHASDLLMSETLAMRSPLEPRTTQGHSRNASPYRATSDIWTTGSMAEKFGWSSVIWAPCWPNAAWKSSIDSKWN